MDHERAGRRKICSDPDELSPRPGENGKLILVEAVVPPGGEPHFAEFIDLNRPGNDRRARTHGRNVRQEGFVDLRRRISPALITSNLRGHTRVVFPQLDVGAQRRVATLIDPRLEANVHWLSFKTFFARLSGISGLAVFCRSTPAKAAMASTCEPLRSD